MVLFIHLKCLLSIEKIARKGYLFFERLTLSEVSLNSWNRLYEGS